MAVLNASEIYVATSWLRLLHAVPHLDLQLQPIHNYTGARFQPEQEKYLESLAVVASMIVLGAVVFLVGFTACYCTALCCCRKMPRSTRGFGCLRFLMALFCILGMYARPAHRLRTASPCPGWLPSQQT
jgi:hypothetical protein